MTFVGTSRCRKSAAAHRQAALRQSNAAAAAGLVCGRCASYARRLPAMRGLEGGAEGPRQGYGPNNYINDPKKKNWAAFARPIFFQFAKRNGQGQL